MATSHASDRLKLGRRREPFATAPHLWIICAWLSPQAQALYTILRAHAVEGGGSVAFPGQQALADLLGFSRRQSVIRYLRELESAGAITITRRVIGRARRNVYEIHETPPPDYTGPRTLAQFYERRRAAQESSPETTPVREQTTTTNREPVGEPNREPIPEYIPEPIQDQSSEGTMCAPANEGWCAPAHEGWCAGAHMNKNKGTRTRELENYYTSRGGSRTRERARPQQRHVHINLPRGHEHLDRGHVTRHLVAATAAAAKHAGKPLGRGVTDQLARMLQDAPDIPAQVLASTLEEMLRRGITDDHDFAWLFTDQPPRRHPAPRTIDEVRDEVGHLPGAEAVIDAMEDRWHPAAIRHTVLATAEAMQR